MSLLVSLEERCADVLHRHLETGGEDTLHEAYEFGRAALSEGAGVLDMAMILWRVALEAQTEALHNGHFAARVQSFVLESLSPFEMAHRGAREASQALRSLDERRELHMQRVARELHDQAGQLLATVFLSLDALRAHLKPEGEASFEKVAELLRGVEDEVRRVAHELRPVVLDDLGLLPALRFLGDGVAQRSGFAITVTGSTEGRLPPRIETEIYRTVQEALSNVARHSHASRALIEVRRTTRDVRCRICDDGRGFDPGVARVAEGARGLGLRGIRERLAPIGGAMEIQSRPGGGTELRVRIPLEVKHEHTGSAGG